MTSEHNPYLRFLFGLVVVALAIRIVWELIEPAIPVLAVLICVGAVVWLIRAYRGRW